MIVNIPDLANKIVCFMKKMGFFCFLVISEQKNYDINTFTGPNHGMWKAGTDPDWFPLLYGKRSDFLTINRIK